MKITTLLVAVLFAAFSLKCQSYAQAPLVTIETVTVGDAGNAPDPATGYGAVSNVFAIGKYEVTISQYTAFLNSVARTNTNSYIVNLWSAQMTVEAIAGISRSGSGSLASPYSYSVIGPSGITPAGASSPGNRPIAYVTWFNAARFANWMHNGATNGASTETGAYTLNGATNGVGFSKNVGARWWIPSEDEWYKAAYYKGGGTNAGYWLYPTQSDNAPGNVISGAPNQANYVVYDDVAGRVLGVTQSKIYSSTQNYLTDVGAFSASASAYGTFDQAGNVWEWNDAVIGSFRCSRGGDLVDSGSTGYERLKSGRRFSFYNHATVNPNFPVGFRVASVPAPTSIAIEQPVGTGITNNAAASSFGTVVVGATSSNRIYTLRNTGGAALNITSFALAGSNPADFQIAPPSSSSLPAGGVTNFSVAFAPTASGSKTAQVSIASNATNNSSFLINLSGSALGEDTDTDGDGLNDAAEFTMSALGFNWQAAQTSLVGTLYTNANRAKLFSQAQYDANRTNGRTDVINNPSIYNLYTSDSIMDLRMGGLMVQRQGSNATVVFQPQTTIDLSQPFTNNGTPITNAIPMPGDKGFIRIRANPTPAQ
jgi:sulfatase modifying factor 1